MEYGLIGEKLGHSYSKEIHNQIGSYDYILKEIPENELSDFMRKKDFRGINVTIPYKQKVIPFLDFVEENARKIGAVNTVVNKGGKLIGYNTDFEGLKRLVQSTGISLKEKKVLILGTGGTSRTALAVTKSLEADETLIVSRSEKPGAITYEEANLRHADVSFIINTTPSGMFPDVAGCPISLESFEKLEGLVDVIYNPLRTKLVLSAQKKGIAAKGGLYMLVQQAIAAFELFFDQESDQNKADAIYKNLLLKKQNIVLVGMPGSGKTTLGLELSKMMKREFYDTDSLIFEREEKSPSEIINEMGEEYFRNLESKVCTELSSVSNGIIATGGGAVLREENVRLLKHNGILFFLDRKLEKIRPTASRPLSNSIKKLKAVYKDRYPIYKSAADYSIESNENVMDSANKVKELFCEN